MGFLSPWFLGGIAAIGLPIYLHLLRRSASTPQPFSSLRFFERRQQSSIRHRRLQYFLLLAARIAVLALIVLAFANPFVNRTAASVAAERLTLLVIDDSVSMRAGTKLADAKRQAATVLATHQQSERIQIGTLGAGLHLLTQPNDDDGTRRAAIASIEPGDSRGGFGELARAIRLMADGLGAPLELHLFSDFQKSKMPPTFTDVVLPDSVSLALHQIGDAATAPNWTVESVDAPAQIWSAAQAAAGQPAEQAQGVEAVIAGHGTPAATRTATMTVNGKVVTTRTVDVPASGRATVQFPSLDVPYGFSRCEVKIDSADALSADDVYRFAVERLEPPKALFVHAASDSRSPLYVGHAIAAAARSAFVLQAVAPEQAANLRLANYAFVILSNLASLPMGLESELTKYVRGGKSVLVAMGTAAIGRTRVPLFGDPIQETRDYGQGRPSGGERFVSVGDIDRSHPSVAKTGNWSDVRVYFAVRVGETDARVVARLTDQTPLLLDKKIGAGHVLLFASGLDNLTNDLPLHPAFVPFIEESAQYLGGVARSAGARVVDSFVELRSPLDPKETQSAGVDVIGPTGDHPLSLTEAATAQSFRLSEAGFYQVRMSNGRQDVIGVNPDRRASNLEILPAEVQALWRGQAGGTARQPTAASSAPASIAPAENVKKPLSLWWYVMILGLVAALSESWLASRYLSVQADET